MREILFRGRGDTKYNDGEWYYGVPIRDFEGDWQICTDNSKRTVIPETIGQYTGLADKNGTKIFEGDIVDVLYDVNYIGVAAERIGVFEVVFHNGCFMKQKGGVQYHFIPSDKCTVIGNIYDNPELLGGNNNG